MVETESLLLTVETSWPGNKIIEFAAMQSGAGLGDTAFHLGLDLAVSGLDKLREKHQHQENDAEDRTTRYDSAHSIRGPPEDGRETLENPQDTSMTAVENATLNVQNTADTNPLTAVSETEVVGIDVKADVTKDRHYSSGLTSQTDADHGLTWGDGKKPANGTTDHDGSQIDTMEHGVVDAEETAGAKDNPTENNPDHKTGHPSAHDDNADLEDEDEDIDTL
jgi:hypothetical protein